MKREKVNRTKETQLDLDCKKATSLIQDYITCELEPDIATELEKHLSICPDCVAFMNIYKKTTDLVSSFFNQRSQKLKKGLKKSLSAKINKKEF
jgi:anti-sigma factor RsiW